MFRTETGVTSCILCRYHTSTWTDADPEYEQRQPFRHICNAPQNLLKYSVCDGPVMGGKAPWWWRGGYRYMMCSTCRDKGLRPPIVRREYEGYGGCEWWESDGDDFGGGHCGPEAIWFLKNLLGDRK